jgi:hypothetical protein
MSKFLSLFGHTGADGYPVPSDLTVWIFLTSVFFGLLSAFGVI